MCNKTHQIRLRGHKSKVKVTRSTNAETGSASYLPDGRPPDFKLGTQMEYMKTRIIDKSVDLQGQRSRSRWHVDMVPLTARRWPINRERKDQETPKLLGRLSNNAQIQFQQIKVQDHLAD